MSEPKERSTSDKTQRAIALTTNAVGVVGGPAAIYAAAKSPALRRKSGASFRADPANAGPILGRLQRKTKPKSVVGRVLRHPKALAAGAAAATGLQVGNMAGDAIAVRYFAPKRENKVEKRMIIVESVAKSDGGSVGRRVDVEKGAGKFLGDATGLRTKKLAAGARTLESSAADARARAATFAPGRRQNRVSRDAKSKTAAADRVEAARTASARSGNKTRAIAGGTAVGAAGVYGAGYQSGGRRRPADQFGKAVPKLPDRFDGPNDPIGTSGGQKVLSDFKALQGKTKKVGRLRRVIRKDEVGKANRESPSAGRLATAVAVPGIHGLVAGDKASGKLKSAGSQVGGSYLVGIPAGLAAMKLGGGRFASQAASAGGGAAGAIGATHLAHRKGWLKPQKKKVAKARSFDPEADRQRRTGAYSGVAAGGSIVAGREAARYIKLKDKATGAKGVFAPKGKGKQALAWSAGSAGLAAVSAGTYKRGVSRRNQPWN